MWYHICWGMGCTTLPAPYFISGRGTDTYGDRPAPSTLVGGLAASAEACLGDRWDCWRERGGVGTCGQALPSLFSRGGVVTPAKPGRQVERPWCHIPHGQTGRGGHVRARCLHISARPPAATTPCPNSTGPRVTPGHRHLVRLSHWTVLCRNDGTPCGLKNFLPLSVLLRLSLM